MTDMNSHEKSITKIVLTGGPCAGKSTGRKRIEEEFTKRGYAVLFISETATELKEGGITKVTCGSNAAFQKYLLKLQLEKERIYEEAAAAMPAEKVLIVCDRAALDNKAYMGEEEFARLLAEIGMNEVELRDTYDGVFHMETAAKGSRENYTTKNNEARTETPEEAVAIDDKLIAAWTGFPHWRIIYNEGRDWDTKQNHLLAEIASLLGEPEPCEIERKFLIEMPDIEELKALPNCQQVEIKQTYLKTDPGEDEEVRIRQRGQDGYFVYYETRKRRVSNMKRIEVERRISKDEYLRLLMNEDTPRRHPIVKTRYCLASGNQYFEIDIYPSLKCMEGQAIMEIELLHEDDEIRFPEQVTVIREVTDDENYTNAALSYRD